MNSHDRLFVYFDAGFTLIRPVPSVGHHYAEGAARYGVVVDVAALDAAFVPAWRAMKESDAIHPELPYGRNLTEARDFWTKAVAACFRHAGVDPPSDPKYYQEMFDLFAEPRCWSLYEDAEEALLFLEEHRIPWGVLSNWDPRLRPVLRGMGLLDRMSALVISSEAGAEKPDPRIFTHAETLTPGRRFALIGDEPEADGRGALRAGWDQCLVWRRPNAPPPGDLQTAVTLIDAVRLVSKPRAT